MSIPQKKGEMGKEGVTIKQETKKKKFPCILGKYNLFANQKEFKPF